MSVLQGQPTWQLRSSVSCYHATINICFIFSSAICSWWIPTWEKVLVSGHYRLNDITSCSSAGIMNAICPSVLNEFDTPGLYSPCYAHNSCTVHKFVLYLRTEGFKLTCWHMNQFHAFFIIWDRTGQVGNLDIGNEKCFRRAWYNFRKVFCIMFPLETVAFNS